MTINEHIRMWFNEELDPENMKGTFALNRFKRRDNKVRNIMPIRRYKLTENFWDYRCLHLLIRQDDSKVMLPAELGQYVILQEMIATTQRYEEFMGKFPYLYLTIDTLFVKAGETQRTPGWHVDCVQGDEVPVKMPTNLTFSWSDTVPMEYADQDFDIPAHVNVSEHNIFEVLSGMVQEDKIRQCEPNMMYVFNTYCLHRSAVAKQDTPRTFIRLSYTHVPITNSSMTVNPDIKYNYEIHSTAGKIPTHLKTTI